MALFFGELLLLLLRFLFFSFLFLFSSFHFANVSFLHWYSLCKSRRRMKKDSKWATLNITLKCEFCEHLMCECIAMRNPLCFWNASMSKETKEKLSFKQTKSSMKCPRITKKLFILLPNTIDSYMDFAFQRPGKNEVIEKCIERIWRTKWKHTNMN